MKSMESTTVVELCPEDEVPEGQTARLWVGETPLAVFNIHGTYYAIGDTCSHEDYPLSDGDVDERGCTVECALHGSRFDLKTGQALSLPATGSVGSFPIWAEDGMLKVEVPSEMLA